MGADEEAKQHIVALAQRLYEFGHRTKERKMEIWHRLGSTVELPEVEHRMAKNEQIMANKYNHFVQKLYGFVNQESGNSGRDSRR